MEQADEMNSLNHSSDVSGNEKLEESPFIQALSQQQSAARHWHFYICLARFVDFVFKLHLDLISRSGNEPKLVPLPSNFGCARDRASAERLRKATCC